MHRSTPCLERHDPSVLRGTFPPSFVWPQVADTTGMGFLISEGTTRSCYICVFCGWKSKLTHATTSKANTQLFNNHIKLHLGLFLCHLQVSFSSTVLLPCFLVHFFVAKWQPLNHWNQKTPLTFFRFHREQWDLNAFIFSQSAVVVNTGH